MTPEEKAKAYDNALNWMRSVYPTMTDSFKEDAEHYFPELKESEDEGIRKALIEGFKNYSSSFSTFGGISDDDILAWLEKQGDSPIKWNKNTEGNKPQVNHSVLMKTKHGIAEGEWQGEHWYQYRWSSVVRDSDVLSWIELSELEKQGEQNPAWSGEDSCCYDDICEILINLIHSPKSNVNKDVVEKDLDWLKSLKERMKGE